MMSAREMVTGTFRVDKTMKESAEKILQDLGMNMSTAINVFLAQVVREQMLPFRPGEGNKLEGKLPSPRLELALEESERIMSGDIMAKKYESFEDLWEDI